MPRRTPEKLLASILWYPRGGDKEVLLTTPIRDRLNLSNLTPGVVVGVIENDYLKTCVKTPVSSR